MDSSEALQGHDAVDTAGLAKQRRRRPLHTSVTWDREKQGSRRYLPMGLILR